MNRCVFKRNFLSIVVASASILSGFTISKNANATGFIDDSTLTGGIYYWQRERDRKDTAKGSDTHGEYVNNLSHATWNFNLDFSSGYYADMFGIDVAAFSAIDMANNSASHPTEMSFSNSNKAYSEDWSGDKDGVSLYKAAGKFKYGPVWAHAGYIQPTGQTLIAPHWSYMPGTYEGAEAGANFDYGQAGALSFSYMWTDKYKSPWHLEMDNFYQNDKESKVGFLQSIGAKYDFKNDLVLEAAYGQAEGFMDQYFAKASYKFNIGSRPVTTSYQFYGAHDKAASHQCVDGKSCSDDGAVTNDIYDGTAWLQALTFGYNPIDTLALRLEGTWVKAEGSQGYFLQRMTPTYASSNGRLDIWWDNRSDFNANGEKAIFLGGMYDMKKWNMAGWAFGASVVYAWDAKPASWIAGTPDEYYDKDNKIEESAYSLDAVYTLQDGRAKGTIIKLHYTEYNNHSQIPNYSGGYGNIFQDEHDVKFMVIAPFTIF
ncbi:outer membrane porin, OprD family [Salmonella enterica subsp. enterica serovar Infantis]|nr:outer membrane porin, OprD family [Salmonella enterica subsp. enterica serovar Infantis]EGI5923292.1 OprD family porin [Salmonella enterica subsp. enterica serovar Colindale]